MKRRKTIKGQQANKESSPASPSVKIKKSSDEVIKADDEARENKDDDELILQDLIDDPSVFIDKFNQHCEDIKRSMQAIKKVKLYSAENSTREVAKIKPQALMSILSLREINRISQMLCKNAKDSTQEAKQKCESVQLQLENLLYEIVHLKEEISKCGQFKPCGDDITLLEVEEFYRVAPENISLPERTRHDPHQLKLAQLQWELQEREKLAEKCRLAKEEKDRLIKRIEDKRKRIRNLNPLLDSVLTATRPLQDYLSLSISQVDSSSSARYLPRPLYFLFVQANAYQEANDSDIGVTITGDLHKAKQFDQNVVEESIRKASSSQSGQGNKKNLELKNLLTPHPLSVSLRLKESDGNSMALSVYYYPILNICAVKGVKIEVSFKLPDVSSVRQTIEDSSLLSCLFPGDTGKDTPNATNHQQLQSLGLPSFNQFVKEIGNPYIWAQSITGLQFFSLEKEELPMEPAGADLLPNVVNAILARTKSKASLLKQLIALENLQMFPTNSDGKLFPIHTYSQIKEFKVGTDVNIESMKKMSAILNKKLQSGNTTAVSIKFSYRRVKLYAVVLLEPDYPVHPPLTNITISSDQRELTANINADIKCIEAEINVFYQELLEYDSADFMLTNILKRLQVCFEICIESRLKELRDKPVTDLPQRMILQSCRGRDRVKPYKYLENPGCFTTRSTAL
ncbi:THO complex subunit 5-like protein [Trichoplax sp. H2]|nr:THO complex subunit 5-like protein [Trichoplax sp. H2]|eukprot:RDD47444.1 THO complex subunit 5-like protein [Trichoplax sp. H2]